MKKIRRWLLNNNLKIYQLADGIGINRSHFRCILSGYRPMSCVVAQKIEKFTEGRIKVSDIWKDGPRKRRVPRKTKPRVKQLDFVEVLEATPDMEKWFKDNVKVAKPGELPENWGKVH